MKLILILATLFVSAASFAQGAPPPPGTVQTYDSCSAIYDGQYTMAGGPLTVRFDRVDFTSNNVNVTLSFRGNVFYGRGICDGGGFNFQLEGGWPHTGQFFYRPYASYPDIRGTQWVYGRAYQKMNLFPRY